MLTTVIALAIFTTRLFPDTPAAHWFTHWLVEKPVQKAAQVERKHLILFGIILFLVTMGGEMVLMLGSWDLAMLWAVDTSIFVDAMIAVWTIATVTSGKRTWGAIKTRLTVLMRPRARARRIKTAERKLPSSANDDDGRWSFAVAA